MSLSLQIFLCRGLQASPLRSAFTKCHRPSSFTKRFSTSEQINDPSPPNENSSNEIDQLKSPWSPANLLLEKGKRNKSRFRQHVNPLARKFQMLSEIHEDWPKDGTFIDPNLPLHIDIGCGKGGFLLELAMDREKTPVPAEGQRNLLGLEIRPSVVQFAKERIERRNLAGKVDFIGCNANVDLERILEKYTQYGEVDLVSLQYPDPHFKKSHQKRRVVTPQLVHTLSKIMKENSEIFIQSDIKEVLDSMRETIRDFGIGYFEDTIDSLDEYLEHNPIGVPTEREVSVLKQNLPVFRTVFRRTNKIWAD